MITLQEYLIEAVAKRTTGKYGFPNRPDKDRMIAFLESNGFMEDADTGKSYWVGPCDPSNKLTFWIKFTDYSKPRSDVFFYRFKYLNQGGYNDFTVTVTDQYAVVHAMTMDEFEKEVFEYFGL